MARIGIFIPDMRGGGAERAALTLIQGFIERGHDVDLIVMNATGELLDLVPDAASIADLQARRIRNATRPLSAYLRKNRPDVLLAVMWPLTIVAVVARMLARVSTRVVVSDHSILSQHYADRPATLAALRLSARLVYPMADVRIVPSRAIAEDFAKLSGLKREAFTLLPNPVSAPDAPIAVGPEIAMLWGTSSLRILSVGALKPEKNHAVLLTAVADIAARHDVRLLILGEGALRPELEILAEELGIAEQVVMPGFRADPWPYYASANLFVLSSDSEGFGNVLVEAMAAGLPVISTNCQGPSEILEGGKWGKLVPINDPSALAAAIEQSTGKRIDREALKARASMFAEDRIADAYLAELLGLSTDGHPN